MHNKYPFTRLRRGRQASWSRLLVKENHLTSSNLILPLFVEEGDGEPSTIESMPGCFNYSIKYIINKAQEAEALRIPAIALFPKIASSKKTEDGIEAINPDNLICRTIRAIKEQKLNIGVIADVALDPYTSHGQDGIVKNGDVDNDLTLEQLKKQAIVLAKAGADIVAPSDMMDGRIGAIRCVLEEEGFKNIIILSYAAKYASKFYGPFRDAIGSTKQLGAQSKSTYQMDPANAKEALSEVTMDIQEGADWLMIKPGMPYLDIIKLVSDHVNVPLFAYQVSGEYTMLHELAKKSHQDFIPLMLEALLSFKRAGADAIFCYAAIEIAKELR
jgi:porphobilinogen synthase